MLLRLRKGVEVRLTDAPTDRRDHADRIPRAIGRNCSRYRHHAPNLPVKEQHV